MDIREERPGDIDDIARVNERAFGRADEGHLVAALRAAAALAASLVAVDAGDIVGHVAFSPVEVTGPAGAFSAIALAPLAVLPSQQHRGIGSRLVNAALVRMRRDGHAIVFVLGPPAYYGRFGFERASERGLRWEHEAPDDAFMVLELEPGALAGRTGVVRYHPAFDRIG